MARRQDNRAILRDLGDGLVLRRATSRDAKALVAFNMKIHGNDDPKDWVVQWARDLVSGKHPTFPVEDFTIVEDTRTGAVVSSLNLISQTWSYAGIEFPVGRPELVGTLPEYRKRGLVRAQMETIHEWSAERGELVQAITGIPFFYRQFGYEMTLELDPARNLPVAAVPKLEDGKKEPFTLRPATESDLAFIAQTYRHGMQRYLVHCPRTRAMWKYEMTGRRTKDEFRIIGNRGGKRLGFFAHWRRAEETLAAYIYELRPGADWLAVTPTVLRYLAATGAQYAAKKNKQLQWISFGLGTEHPAYQVTPDSRWQMHGPYAYYLRLPDLPRFIRHIAPVRERRLAESVAAGHTGELKLSFYTGGLHLVLKNGKLTRVGAWSPGEGASAAFPYLSFIGILFGHRTLGDLRAVYPDSWANDTAQVLLPTLFPKQASYVWPWY